MTDAASAALELEPRLHGSGGLEFRNGRGGDRDIYRRAYTSIQSLRLLVHVHVRVLRLRWHSIASFEFSTIRQLRMRMQAAASAAALRNCARSRLDPEARDRDSMRTYC